MESTPEAACETALEALVGERRRAPRFAIEAPVSIQKDSGETAHGFAINMSSCGLLLRLEQPFPLDIGEEVTVVVDLPNHPEKPLAVWGVATVVRAEGLESAVHLLAGSFAPHLFDQK